MPPTVRGWDDVEGADAKRAGLTGEAIQLGKAAVMLLPQHPEPLGVLALMLFCETRATARRDAQGRYVALLAQDTAPWDIARLQQAEALLFQASRFGELGPFQLEAAIQERRAQ